MTDTFTEGSDTTLASHTSDTGQTWAFVGGSANTMVVVAATDKLDNDGPFADGGYGYQSSFVPSDADYCTEMVVNMSAVSSGENSVGVAVRQTVSGTDCVFMNWVAGTGWQIRLSNGLTQIGATYNGDTPNSDITIRLCVTGNDYTGYVQGVSRITGTNGTITATGRPGLYSEVAGVGAGTYDNYKVYNTAP